MYISYVELHIVFPKRLVRGQRLRTVIPDENPFRAGHLFRIFVRDEVLFAQTVPGVDDFIRFSDIELAGSVPPARVKGACPRQEEGSVSAR
jgi:hypothetical protein